MADEFEDRIRDAIANPKNLGEMADADAVGTVGNPECGDMVRLWLKFAEKDGKKIIDRASFQSFGCQTAVAVASLATELLAGKSVEEARTLRAEDLGRSLGPLPPVKIHCGQMVEGALREALEQERRGESSGGHPLPEPASGREAGDGGLVETLHAAQGKKVKVVRLNG